MEMSSLYIEHGSAVVQGGGGEGCVFLQHPIPHPCLLLAHVQWLKGIVQPFELGGETRLIRSAVKK